MTVGKGIEINANGGNGGDGGEGGGTGGAGGKGGMLTINTPAAALLMSKGVNFYADGGAGGDGGDDGGIGGAGGKGGRITIASASFGAPSHTRPLRAAEVERQAEADMGQYASTELTALPEFTS